MDGCQGAHNPKVVGSNPTPATISTPKAQVSDLGLRRCVLSIRRAVVSTLIRRVVNPTSEACPTTALRGRPDLHRRSASAKNAAALIGSRSMRGGDSEFTAGVGSAPMGVEARLRAVEGRIAAANELE